jgi:small nuclear ribonucleoprotein D3
MAGLGVPVKLLHESLGHVVTVELKTGQLYRGKLAEGMYSRAMAIPFVDAIPAEDNLNISLKEITVTGRDGRVSQLDQVYIRGSMVRFFIVPDMLQNAPMSVLLIVFYIYLSSAENFRFKRVGPNAMRGRGIGTARGRATIMRGTIVLFFFRSTACR